jgi:hypothetical protein
MEPGQDWCLQCGAGAPGSLGGLPGWRSAATLAAAVAILAVGAAAAAYAALNKKANKPSAKSSVVIVAKTATPTSTSPAATIPSSTPATNTPATTPTTTTPAKASAPPLPPSSSKPPALPAVSSTPESSSQASKAANPSSETGTSKESGTGSASSKSEASEKESSSAKSGEGSAGKTEQPSPILLDTNAASNYNPFGYPATTFGDPRLAIDGDATTAWTTQINPATAPKMAQGLVINLKSPQPVAKLSLVTATPGMTVQIYGANTKSVPSSISDHAWTSLAGSHLVKDGKASIKLVQSSKSFRYVLLWIIKAPQSLIGTPEAPAVLDVNELVLYAPK